MPKKCTRNVYFSLISDTLHLRLFTLWARWYKCDMCVVCMDGERSIEEPMARWWGARLWSYYVLVIFVLHCYCCLERHTSSALPLNSHFLSTSSPFSLFLLPSLFFSRQPSYPPLFTIPLFFYLSCAVYHCFSYAIASARTNKMHSRWKEKHHRKWTSLNFKEKWTIR